MMRFEKLGNLSMFLLDVDGPIRIDDGDLPG